MKIIYLFILPVLFIGCLTKYIVFVVSRDVPDNPSFVVMPTNYYQHQVNYANIIEEYLISSGVKVIARPIKKEVEETKQAARVETQPSQAMGAQATITEKYSALDETDADYFVETNEDTKVIKIIRKTTKEVLVSFILNSTHTKDEKHVFQEMLEGLGIISLQKLREKNKEEGRYWN